MAVQGVVKTYDPRTGTGVIVRDDDKTEVYLRPGSLEGSIFRFLRQGQRVIFDTVEEAGVVYALRIRVGQDVY